MSDPSHPDPTSPTSAPPDAPGSTRDDVGAGAPARKRLATLRAAASRSGDGRATAKATRGDEGDRTGQGADEAGADVRPRPSATGFDLLEGAFTKARHRRLAVLGLIGMLLAVLIGVGGHGLVKGREVDDLDQQLARAEARHSELEAELNEELGAGGADLGDLGDHVDATAPGVLAAADADLDAVAIVERVLAATPDDATVSQITIAHEGGGTASVAISGEVPTLSGPAAWRDGGDDRDGDGGLDGADGISVADVTSNGNEPSISVEIQAQITEVRTDRATQLRQQLPDHTARGSS